MSVGGRRYGDLAEYFGDVKKAKEVLNWAVKPDLDEMSQDLLRWQKMGMIGQVI